MRLAVGDGEKMYIIIIKLDVISISIIKSIIKLFKSLSTVSRASVVESGGSGLNFFLGLRNIREGGDRSHVGLFLAFAGVALLAAPCGLPALCSTAPCTFFPTSEYGVEIFVCMTGGGGA